MPMTDTTCDREALLAIADELDEEYEAYAGLLMTGSAAKPAMALGGNLERALHNHEVAERIRTACGAVA